LSGNLEVPCGHRRGHRLKCAPSALDLNQDGGQFVEDLAGEKPEPPDPRCEAIASDSVQILLPSTPS